MLQEAFCESQSPGLQSINALSLSHLTFVTTIRIFHLVGSTSFPVYFDINALLMRKSIAELQAKQIRSLVRNVPITGMNKCYSSGEEVSAHETEDNVSDLVC